jgi:ABC-type branched-subunit amino acid transport system substrate-binding protein
MLRRVIAGLALTAGLTAALAPVAYSADKVELTVGKLLELTGPLSESAPSQDKAIQLAIKYANEQAAAAGVPITVKDVGADVQGDPQAALSAARTLVDQGASCLIGPSITPESIAIANGVTIAKKVTIWPTGTSMRLRTIDGKGTIYRTVPPDSLQALALAAAAEDLLGGAKDKVASVVYRNEPYGEGLSKDFAAAWEAKGGKVQGPVVFDPQQASFDSEAGQVVANDPAVIIAVDYPDTYAKLGAALVRTGKFDPKKLIVADALFFSTVPENIPPEAIEGARVTHGGTPQGTADAALFDKLWTDAGGAEHFALDANSFDSTTLCILAAAAAKSSDSAAVTDHIPDVTTPGGKAFSPSTLGDALKAAWAGEKINYSGVVGSFEFAANGDPTISLFDINQYKDGKPTVLKQIDVKK